MLLISLLLFLYDMRPRGCRREDGGSSGGSGSGDGTSCTSDFETDEKTGERDSLAEAHRLDATGAD